MVRSLCVSLDEGETMFVYSFSRYKSTILLFKQRWSIRRISTSHLRCCDDSLARTSSSTIRITVQRRRLRQTHSSPMVGEFACYLQQGYVMRFSSSRNCVHVLPVRYYTQVLDTASEKEITPTMTSRDPRLQVTPGWGWPMQRVHTVLHIHILE